MHTLYFTSQGNIGLTENRLCFEKSVEATDTVAEADDQSARDKAFQVLRDGDKPRAQVSADEAETLINLRDALSAIARQRGENDEVAPTSLTTYPAYGEEQVAG
ncbi:hypothetical protein KKA95_02470 [Patescibacteria group bacterium]|nr:hypothetical protein [Patescibacteria group bacterium]